MKLSGCLLFCLILFSACKNQTEKKTEPKKDTSATVAENWELLPFTKIDSVNPIMAPHTDKFFDPVRKIQVAWEAKDVFNPAATVRHDTLFLLYRAQDKIGKPDGTSRIGLA